MAAAGWFFFELRYDRKFHTTYLGPCSLFIAAIPALADALTWRTFLDIVVAWPSPGGVLESALPVALFVPVLFPFAVAVGAAAARRCSDKRDSVQNDILTIGSLQKSQRKDMCMPKTAEMSEKAIYEPPQLVEVGGFAEVTQGAEDRPSDYPYFKQGYWLI